MRYSIPFSKPSVQGLCGQEYVAIWLPIPLFSPRQHKSSSCDWRGDCRFVRWRLLYSPPKSSQVTYQTGYVENVDNVVVVSLLHHSTIRHINNTHFNLYEFVVNYVMHLFVLLLLLLFLGWAHSVKFSMIFGVLRDNYSMLSPIACVYA